MRGFSLIGKLGAIYATTKTTAATSGALSSTDTDGKRRGWSEKWGLGADYDLSKKTALRLEYEHVSRIVNDNTIGKNDIAIWSMGLKYRF